MIDNPNRKEFISAFKAEAEEHIERLNKGLLTIEKDPKNLQVIKLLFREAHTLKGAAQMMGFNEIKKIAHKVEDVFGVIQEGKIAFNSHIADIIFQALDSVKIILNKIVKGEEIDTDISVVCREIDEVTTPESSSQTANDLKEAKSTEKEVEIEETLMPTIVGTKKDENRTTPTQPPPSRGRGGIESEDISHSNTPLKEEYIETPLKEEYIHIPISRANKLMNLIGETVINRLRFSYHLDSLKKLRRFAETTQRRLASFSDTFKVFSDHTGYEELFESLHQCNLDIGRIREDIANFFDSISTEAMHMDPILNELQQRVKEIRMLPCSTIFEGFPRLIRDISREQEKDVDLVIEGEDTELDKKVLEKIKPSLIHILRNCVDHGIEMPEEREGMGKHRRGTVRLSAIQEGGNVLIEVEDDGRGIETEEVKRMALKKRLVTQGDLDQMSEEEINNLIFTDGFSTSPIITDISGRGVGLDIVRANIEGLKGRVEIKSQKGIGTKVKLTLPLTITVIRVLLLKSNDQIFGMPIPSVDEFIEVNHKEIYTVNTRMAIHVRDQTIPLVRLNEVLNLPKKDIAQEETLMPTSFGTKREKNLSRSEARDHFDHTPTQPPPSRGGWGIEEVFSEEKVEVFSVVIVSSLGKRIGFIVDQIKGEEEIFMKSLGSHLGKVKNISGTAILGTGEVIVILNVADLISEAGMSHPGVIHRRGLEVEERGNKLILVVEDSLIIRELEKNMLEFQGYDVDIAIDGIEAMGKISQTKPDLIISDIQMPRMDGFELCKSIRENDKYKEIPIIMVTSLEKEEDKRRGIEVGADAYIVKNEFDQANLLSTIERLIG